MVGTNVSAYAFRFGGRGGNRIPRRLEEGRPGRPFASFGGGFETVFLEDVPNRLTGDGLLAAQRSPDQHGKADCLLQASDRR